ncbi:putative Aldo keto reductase [Rosellinia necatrix]|uniref:Putative Aldo keto reductase n=1 Tax=Rosellinia necatrix TaxID=77044 RepID=A0A1W2TTZ0_ROSNE|nr:putative Aldo keto reductase [Rosellinia necatrix]
MAYKIVGKNVKDIGFGLMSLNLPREEPISVDDKISMIKAAIDSGANLLNGSEFYGPSLKDNSLTLLKSYFEKYPEDADKVVISIKGGMRLPMEVDNSPEFTRASIENCLSLIGDKGKIDLWEMARRTTQDEYIQSLRVIDSYVKQGKIGGVTLSEVNANSIRQAAKVVKVAGVEIELSLFHTDPLHNGICAACAELDIPIFAYSPLGRGFLTGKVQKPEDIYVYFRQMPRFQEAHFDENMKLVEKVKEWAAKRGCTPAQFSINWLAALSSRPNMPKIIPIPGAANLERIKENIYEVKLTDEDMDEVDGFLNKFNISGERFPEVHARWLDSNETTEVTA